MKSNVLLIALFTTVFAIGAKAQSTTFGARAGFGLQNINGQYDDDHKYDNKMKFGINLGFNAEIPVTEEVYIQPGLLFATKGAKDKTYRKAKISLSYLEIPINLLFKPELGDGKLLLGFGPYLAFAVGGSYTNANGDKAQFKFAHKVTQSEYAGSAYVRRMDFGVNFLAGYELSSKLSFQLNAGLGLANIATKVEGFNNSGKTKNTGFGISAGYRFK
ncbi:MULTISPECIES: porin family protein [Niastella]|uniref:PorT family protein n=1 Tax=Niastella soli TaxID=2821487 RepID=A0ABS3YSL9_9BACT|nr:porin family protein [Niastella soli]MBO9200884.1 PorT family protein [Niastella soli]